MSQIEREIAEIPARAADALSHGAEAARSLEEQWRARPPAVILTLARGSSEAAAAYGRTLFSHLLACPAGTLDAASPAFFGTAMRFSQACLIAVSQSGRSPDLVDTLQGFSTGADAASRSLAFVNDASSPLADGADMAIDVAAGPELSIAATKSVTCSMVALARLAAGLAEDTALIDALEALPGALEADLAAGDTLPEIGPLATAGSAFTLGRDLTMPLAKEAAVKLKETSVFHAEAQDSAEVMHGPRALVEASFPIIAFRPAGAARAPFDKAVDELAGLGATIMPVDCPDDGPGAHPALRPIRQLTRFYARLPAIAAARGHDADRPRNLTKVTQTA